MAIPVQQAVRAVDFTQSIGVNAHLDSTGSSYGNVNAVISQMQFLGVDHLRDEVPDTAHLAAFASVGASGVKLDLIVMGNLGLSMASLDRLAPYVGLVEGPNEVNVTFVQYGGLSAVPAAVAFQQALYAAVYGDPTLNGAGHATPVVNFSVAIGGRYAGYGNLAPYADYTNVHAYAQYGFPAFLWLKQEIYGTTDTPGRPLLITETGNYTMLDHASGVSEDAQAKLGLYTLLDAFKNGVKSTYLYQLQDGFADPNNTNGELHYGLFHADGTAKVEATAIHNLTTLLADPGAAAAAFTTAPLSYAVSGLPASGNQFVMQKSDGSYAIALWQEPSFWDPTTNGELGTLPTTVTITLAASYRTIAVYDPLLGTTAIATAHDARTIAVALGADPLVIEIDNAGPASAPAGATPTVSLAASALAAAAPGLRGAASAYALALTGDAMLATAAGPGALDTLQALAATGKLTAISLDTAPAPALLVTADELTTDAAALGKITGNYTLTVGGVSAAAASGMARQAHVTAVSVIDGAANVAANLDALQVLASSGVLTSISLTDPGTPVLAITAAQLRRDAAALAKVAGAVSVAATDATALDTSTGRGVAATAQVYTGPVHGIDYQFLDLSPDNLNLSVRTDNWFLHSGAGEDALAVTGGTNVLDGGTGSNFLTGGSGADTFFVDDRAAPADIWSTVSNFHAGDAATVFGVNATSFKLDWVDGQGAAGYTGLTAHFTAPGAATALLTLVGYTKADLGNGTLAVSYGGSGADSYMYIHR